MMVQHDATQKAAASSVAPVAAPLGRTASERPAGFRAQVLPVGLRVEGLGFRVEMD